jgi:hypothetical protein
MQTFSHDSNDAQKTMGIITLALFVRTRVNLFKDLPGWLQFPQTPQFQIGTWVKVTCSSTMAVGQRQRSRNRCSGWLQLQPGIKLLNHGRMVWEHVHDKKIGKPYMRFGLLDGTELTRPWPVPKDYPKSDHVWHRALWWSWKMINGVNYWEENQTGTEPIDTLEQAARSVEHLRKVVG